MRILIQQLVPNFILICWFALWNARSAIFSRTSVSTTIYFHSCRTSFPFLWSLCCPLSLLKYLKFWLCIKCKKFNHFLFFVKSCAYWYCGNFQLLILECFLNEMDKMWTWPCRQLSIISNWPQDSVFGKFMDFLVLCIILKSSLLRNFVIDHLYFLDY